MSMQAIDPDYEPTFVAPRVAMCYDAYRRTYVKRLVWRMGLQGVQPRTGDEAMAFEPPPPDDESPGLTAARAAMRTIVAEKRQAVVEAVRQMDKPLTYRQIAEATGFTQTWLKVHLPLMDDVVMVARSARGKLFGLRDVEYKLPDWIRREAS